MESVDEIIDHGKPEMHINLKNNIYFPGEIIRGKIFLKSGNFFKKGIIIYEIYGQEQIKENKYNMEFNNSTKIFYSSLEYPGLINYSLSSGIQIPFEINLPSYILPSFEFSQYYMNNKNSYGYIKNFIQIEIPELNLIKQKFIIFRRPLLKLNSPLTYQAERNEKLFGIFNKGCPILITSYNKNYYHFNEIIPLKITLNNNNSKFDINNINIKLIRNVVFKLKDNCSDKKIEDIIFTDELFNKSINLIEKKDNKNANIINIEEKIKIEEPEKIFNKHNIDYLSLGLRDKSKLILFLPSFDSSLFKCEYIIKIIGIYDTIFPVSNLIINMPISVYHNEEERIKENNEFNLLNSMYENVIKEEQNNDEINELIDKPGYNRKERNLPKENIKVANKKDIKDEVKTYTNDTEKKWNNITNGQIIPELYNIENDKK